MKIDAIADIKETAHDVLFKFQTGKFSREDVYGAAIDLVIQFNRLVTETSHDEEEAQDVADILFVLKSISK
ncbi:hypothetical protein [Pantoea agglomerans]|uniref:hypothetical protein n=1 Tax=Enterobacter agglomerans TaxID=549 RepID=UPI002413837D|nr:hypothetical protein [Pantoea agglomerans]